MTYAIRLFTEADYRAIPALLQAVQGETHSVESLRAEDANIHPTCKWRRWVAEAGGQIVGFGGYSQYIGSYHPQRFELSLGVHPEFRGQGIGSALYRTVTEALREYDPLTLAAQVREDQAGGVAFALRRGYVEKLRNWELHLDLGTLDLSPYAGLLERLAAGGYGVKSWAELADYPDRDRRVYEMVRVLRRDVPWAGTRTDVPFEQWLRGFSLPRFRSDTYMVGMHNGEPVGLSAIYNTDEPSALTTGLTAVAREHRGSGLAMAMKVRGLNVVKGAGFAKVKTWNASHNEKMLAINTKLGFMKQPAWISFLLHLGPEA